MRRRAFCWILAVAISCSGVAFAAAPPNLTEALAAQRRLAEETPTPAVLNDLGNLLVLSGRLVEAESVYRRVLSLDGRNSEAQFNLGLLLQNRGELDAASGLFTSVVDVYPTHAWAHYQLGAIHEALGENDEAITSYATALALDPELYFPDVNPQVVGNQLLTQSLLEAAELRRPRHMVPMSYARPREITELLLSLPQGEAPAAEQEPDD